MNNRISQILLYLLAFLVLTTTLALAQGSSYTISRWSFGSGSSQSGGDYRLYGIAGQPDAGESLSGEGFTMTGGLGPDEAPSPPQSQAQIYLPLVIRNP